MTTLVDDLQKGLEGARLTLDWAHVHDPDLVQYWEDRARKWKCAVKLARAGCPIDDVYTLSGLG